MQQPVLTTVAGGIRVGSWRDEPPQEPLQADRVGGVRAVVGGDLYHLRHLEPHLRLPITLDNLYREILCFSRLMQQI